jgi:hypothetical protein
MSNKREATYHGPVSDDGARVEAERLTPTTEQIRSHLCSMAHLVGRGATADGEMFDRWLAAERAAWQAAQPVVVSADDIRIAWATVFSDDLYTGHARAMANAINTRRAALGITTEPTQ